MSFTIEHPDVAMPIFSSEAMAVGWLEGYETAVQALRDEGVVVQFGDKPFPCERCTSMTGLPHWDCYDETTEIVPGA